MPLSTRDASADDLAQALGAADLLLARHAQLDALTDLAGQAIALFEQAKLIVASGLLAAEDAEVVTAEDGLAAVRAVRDGGFDLVLLDLQMPRMPGLSAVAAIRALPDDAARTRVLALTAETLEQSRAACLAAGMDGVLVEPVRGADVRRVPAEVGRPAVAG